MVSFGMLVCSFYVKKKFSRKNNGIYNLNREIVSSSDEKEEKSFNDIFELLDLFYEEFISFVDDERSKKMFSIKEGSKHIDETETYKAFSFIIQSGSYGVEADMTDRYTQEVSHHRTEDEAEIKSFHCVVYIPKDCEDVIVNKGILVFQSIATYGVKTITVDIMKSFFSKLGITLITRSVSVEAFLQKLIDQGSLRKIIFYKNRISPNIADNILINTGREEIAYINPIFRQEWLRKTLKVFKKADEDKIIEIPDDDDYDDLSIHFTLGDRKRTVRLRNLDKLSIVEDIPDGIVDKDDNARLIEYMISTANEYKEKLVFEVQDGD